MAASIPLQDTATREDLGMLAVMEALAEDEEVTQRELSLRSGLHLKKVNYCLHKLLEKRASGRGRRSPPTGVGWGAGNGPGRAGRGRPSARAAGRARVQGLAATVGTG